MKGLHCFQSRMDNQRCSATLTYPQSAALCVFKVYRAIELKPRYGQPELTQEPWWLTSSVTPVTPGAKHSTGSVD